jgi:hypothetical protein
MTAGMLAEYAENVTIVEMLLVIHPKPEWSRSSRSSRINVYRLWRSHLKKREYTNHINIISLQTCIKKFK